ncbi:hypothetical protein Tco_0090366 [Tanacetum coccineum]
MEILIKMCLMPLALKTQNDSFAFVHELKQEMHADLKYVESLEDEINELESDKAEFSNMYDMILQECVSNDIIHRIHREPCSQSTLLKLHGMPEDPYVEATLQALPSPDYVPGLEEPEQAPPSPDYVPGLEHTDDEIDDDEDPEGGSFDYSAEGEIRDDKGMTIRGG